MRLVSWNWASERIHFWINSVHARETLPVFKSIAAAGRIPSTSLNRSGKTAKDYVYCTSCSAKHCRMLAVHNSNVQF